MVKISNIGQKIIKSIIENTSSNDRTLSKGIIDCLTGDTCGIFISEKCDTFILYEKEEQYHNLSKILVDVLIVVEYLKSEGYIYLIGNKVEPSFLASNRTSTLVGIDDNDKYIVDDVTFSVEDGKKSFKGLNCKRCEGLLSTKFSEIFYNYLYTTPSLEEFYNNGFKTNDVIALEHQLEVEKNNAKEAKCSRNIAWISLIISLVVGPLISVFVNNIIGETTIDNNQYTRVIKTIDSCCFLINKNQEEIMSLNRDLLKKQVTKKIDINSIDKKNQDSTKKNSAEHNK